MRIATLSPALAFRGSAKPPAHVIVFDPLEPLSNNSRLWPGTASSSFRPLTAVEKRAGYLLNDNAQFELARRLRSPEGITLGEAFSFLSGLYFRGKIAYAKKFACASLSTSGAYVLTTNRGLLPPDTRIDVSALRALGTGDIDPAERSYRTPLLRDANALAKNAGPDCEFVLLGSIATGKYVDLLSEALGDRLRFPSDFVGRGDMSRGGLMLRRAASGEELNYIPIIGATRKGKRPAKLEPVLRKPSPLPRDT